MRHLLHFSYNGTAYHGWQIQPNAISVQEVLQTCVSAILGQEIQVHGAGRTDTGVHAISMFAHFEYEKNLPENFCDKLNSILPKDIAVIGIFAVKPNFHARFDAISRTYFYKIHQVKDVFSENLSWFYKQNIDVEIMNLAAAKLLRHTDFQCFSKVHTDVNTYDCKISEAFWATENGQLIFTVTADRFLRNMVRAIVGTLINAGLGKISLDDFQRILDSKDRRQAGFSVPAHGLYLADIRYLKEFEPLSRNKNHKTLNASDS